MIDKNRILKGIQEFRMQGNDEEVLQFDVFFLFNYYVVTEYFLLLALSDTLKSVTHYSSLITHFGKINNELTKFKECPIFLLNK